MAGSHKSHKCKGGEWKQGSIKECKVCTPPKKSNLAIKVKW